ncbi:MAG: MarR family transcriptional regulator [Planctomycetota bacterium]|nr:MAG: MarR family transcriptional regulator [Planctomycetota bacterium]
MRYYDVLVESALPYQILERIGTLLRAEERRLAALCGLKPAQWSALCYLARCNRYSDTPSAVGEYLGTTKGTTSQTLRRLQEKGLLREVADSHDRRVVHWRLSAAGKKMFRNHGPESAIEPFLQGLSKDRDSRNLLQEILRRLQKANDYRSFGICGSCNHFRRLGGGRFQCGLTGESLRAEEASLLCREHQEPVAT